MTMSLGPLGWAGDGTPSSAEAGRGLGSLTTGRPALAANSAAMAIHMVM